MRRLGIALGLSLLAVLGCDSATEDDRSRLLELQSKYGDRYSFAFKEPIYLMATRRSTGAPEPEELQRIFWLFWSAGNETTKRQSSYTYLNVYDSEGRFVTQLYYDPQRREVVSSSKREFY